MRCPLLEIIAGCGSLAIKAKLHPCSQNKIHMVGGCHPQRIIMVKTMRPRLPTVHGLKLDPFQNTDNELHHFEGKYAKNATQPLALKQDWTP